MKIPDPPGVWDCLKLNRGAGQREWLTTVQVGLTATVVTA